MTAAWSKGRSTNYPYYTCYQRGCERRSKSLRKEKLEGDFETLLKGLKPEPKLLKLIRSMFTDRWDQESRNGRERAAATRSKIASLDSKIDKLINRIMEAEKARVIKAYEIEIAAVEEEKIGPEELAAAAVQPRMSFEQSFRTAWAFLSNPCKL